MHERIVSDSKIIKIDNLCKNFRQVEKGKGFSGALKALVMPKYKNVEAVKNLSFDVEKGEVVSLIGKNGAGKSTTIKLMTGILTPSAGNIEIDGLIPYKNRKEYVKKIGVVFGQRTQLWWDLPLIETYDILKKIYGVSNERYKSKFEYLNEILKLEGFINQPVRTLSLGQRMRADIAAALIHSPSVLFLDEPTIGLDVEVKDNIRRAILEINQFEKTTIILTTHDISDIELLSNRIVMIDNGVKLYDGSLKQMKLMFGKSREMSVTIANKRFDIDKFYCDTGVDKSYCQINQKDDKVIFSFNDKIEISKLISSLLSFVEILDIQIMGYDLESIIRDLYRNEVSAGDENQE